MSRSYKKYPVIKDNQRGGARFGKKHANHRFRQRLKQDLLNEEYEDYDTYKQHSRYKKYSESYDIHDFVYYYTEEDAIESWYKEEQDIINGKEFSFKYFWNGYPCSNFSLHYRYQTLERYLNRYWRKEYLGK